MAATFVAPKFDVYRVNTRFWQCLHTYLSRKLTISAFVLGHKRWSEKSIKVSLRKSLGSLNVEEDQDGDSQFARRRTIFAVYGVYRNVCQPR